MLGMTDNPGFEIAAGFREGNGITRGKSGDSIVPVNYIALLG